MAEYAVDVQTIEYSETSISATGAVNGKQAAVVVYRSAVPYASRVDALLLREFLAKELAKAFVAAPAKEISASHTKVTLD